MDHEVHIKATYSLSKIKGGEKETYDQCLHVICKVSCLLQVSIKKISGDKTAQHLFKYQLRDNSHKLKV